MAGTAFVSDQVHEIQQAEVMLLVFAEETFCNRPGVEPETFARDCSHTV